MDYPAARMKHIQVHFEQNFAQLAKLLSCAPSLPPLANIDQQVKFSLERVHFIEMVRHLLRSTSQVS